MIRKKTVIILGAGASIPYGFPSGIQLFDSICSFLKSYNSAYGQLLLEANFQPNEIINFREALYYSGKSSVDEFLEHRTDFIKIGKAAIAMVLLPFEITENLFKLNDDKNWYKELFRQMNTKLDDFLSNKVSFITFNYDRSLEHFLFLSLKNSYNLSDENCANYLKGIKIIHVHGKLGDHPFDNFEALKCFNNYKLNKNDLYFSRFKNGITHKNVYYRDFDLDTSSGAIREAAKCINIIHDEESIEEYKKAHMLLDEAEVILFLGFGFHELNLNRLKINKFGRGKLVVGTSLGVSEIRKDKIAQLSEKTVLKHHLKDMDIVNFLKEYYILK